MANLSKQQVKVILDSAPKSMDRGKIIEFLAENGNIMEGYNDQPAPVQDGGIFGPAKEAFGGLKQLYGGGEHGIANKLGQDIQGAATDIQQGTEQGGIGGALTTVKGVTKAGFRTAGDVAGTVYAPIGAAIGATGLNKVFDFIGSHYDDALKALTGSGLSDIPEFQQFAMDHPNAGEDFGRALNLALSQGEKGQIAPETIIPRTIEQVKALPSNIQGAAKNVSNKVSPLVDKIQMPQDTSSKGSKGAQIIDTAMRDTVSKYTVATDILQNSEGKFGTDPIGVIKSYGNKAIPIMENGRMNSGESIDFLKKQIGELSNLKNDAVFLNDNVVSFNEFRKQALSQAIAEGNRSGWTKMQQDIVAKDVNKIVDDLQASYKGKDLPMNEFDKIKTEQTGLSKTYKNPNNKFSYDAHSIIGKTSRSLVETFTQDAPTKELNKLIQSHYDAIDLLDSLQGKTPFGGMMTKNFNRLAGELVGATAGSAVGHPIIGAFAGRQIADMMGGILQSDLISNPLKKMIVDNMQGVEPAVKKQMMQYIDENSPDITELGDQQFKDKQNIPPKPKSPKSSLKGKGEIPKTKITKDSNLTGKDVKIQNASIAKYEASPKKMLNAFRKKFGPNISNADQARTLFKDVGYNGSNSAAVHEASSALSKDVWRYNLANNKGDYGVLYSGVSGAGKSTALSLIPEISNILDSAASILDGNLSSYDSAAARIKETIDAGKIPVVVHIYREPLDAFEFGQITRMNNKESPDFRRVVPTKVTANNGPGSRSTVEKIIAQAKAHGIPEKYIYLIDNSLGKGNARITTLAELKAKTYPSNLKALLDKKAQELYEKGKITKGQLKQLIQ